MTVPGQPMTGTALAVAHAFDIEAAKARLAANGGYEIIHESPGLEIGVYVLVAPEPDRQQPHADDEVYVVLEGTGHARLEGSGRAARGPRRLRSRWRRAPVHRLRAAERARDLREGPRMSRRERR